MNRTVWKYELEPTRYTKLIMPRGAEILSAQMQGDKPHLWALVNPSEQEQEIRVILVTGTGHNIVDQNLKFIDTFQMTSKIMGIFVFHAFEVFQ